VKTEHLVAKRGRGSFGAGGWGALMGEGVITSSTGVMYRVLVVPG